MADYLTTDTELTSIADAIRTKGGTSASLTFPAGFVSAINDIPSGGGSSEYELLYSGEVTVNQTSTSETSVATINVGSSILTTGKLVYVQIRDKAGKRNGYFLGSDTWYPNPTGGGVTSGMVTLVYSYLNMFTITTNKYGVYSTTINNAGDVYIKAKYNSTYSRTIDGTYTVKIYLLKWPDNVSPFN